MTRGGGEKNSFNSTSKRKRFFKGVKSFLSNHKSSKEQTAVIQQQQQAEEKKEEQDIYTKEGVAVTLTTEFNIQNQQVSTSLLNPSNSFNFVPVTAHSNNNNNNNNLNLNSSYFFGENKAYVHYEPKKGLVTIGTSAENNYKSTRNKHNNNSSLIKISVEQYAWLIQQLQQEKVISNSIFELFQLKSLAVSAMLSVIISDESAAAETVGYNSSTLSKKFKRLFQSPQQQQQQQKRTSFFVLTSQQQRDKKHNVFILPKALLLQASLYIPMTKPLPPPVPKIQYNILNNQPYQIINQGYKEQLKRYCQYITFCSHELFATNVQSTVEQEPSPPSSIINKEASSDDQQLVKIHCADCSVVTTNLSTLISSKNNKKEVSFLSSSIAKRAAAKKNKRSTSLRISKQQSIMFPISFIQQYNPLTTAVTIKIQQQKGKEKEKLFMSSAIQTSTSSSQRKRVVFDSFTRKQKPHAISAFQYIPPDKNVSSVSTISSISQYSATVAAEGVGAEEVGAEEEEEEEDEEGELEEQLEEESAQPQAQQEEKYGFVAVDNENEEILIVFPGLNMSHNMLQNASFASVPWHEIMNSVINTPTVDGDYEEQEVPFVLECALTAWNKCEIKVVTLLMRLCSALPAHFKVVIVGYSLGGAVAALCASSLRSTKLLVNRPITVIGIHTPRVGDKAFLSSLSNQNVKTIRITHHKDLLAQLPPTTSGLLHIGSDSTVILPPVADQETTFVLENMSTIQDTLDKTFSFSDFHLNANSVVWDINLGANHDHTATATTITNTKN